MTVLSSDIDEQILAALSLIFTYELQTNIAGDSLALRTLKQMDLQDDPTLTAPFVVYAPDTEKEIRLVNHEEMKEYGCAEIGGPVIYLHHYHGKFGTPLATTRESARILIYTLGKRIRNCLLKYEDLSGVLALGQLSSEDQTEVIEVQNNRLVTMLHCRIYGGETTFYGAGEIYWQYPVSVSVPPRSFRSVAGPG